MKIAFWFVGASCAGKSYHAKKTAEKLNCRWVSLDTINDKIDLNGMTREEGYNFLFKDAGDVVVVDGIIPFSFSVDNGLVRFHLKEYEIIYILVKPYYDNWIKNRDKRKIEYVGSDPLFFSVEEYEDYYDYFKEEIGKYLEIKTEEDLNAINLEEEIRNLNYQHEGFTDVKFKQLAIPCEGKSVLDLGCSSCQYEPLFMSAGAKYYHGLDVNLSYLIKKSAEQFNINNLENYKIVEKYDIVVCSSVMHYIHDKEKFIKECSRLAKELCVLEIPLDRGEGNALHLGSRNLYFPTKGLMEEWLSKYFKSFECLGESIVEDGSYRLIYHCKNI